KPQTPLERIAACPQADPTKIAELKKLKDCTDPFELAKTIEQKLDRLYKMANHRVSPSTQETDSRTSKPLTRIEKQTLKKISQIFGGNVYVGALKDRPNS
ncbi:MAG: hypothetical protein AABZ69_03795, partial [Candidatus Binatota bacterium]